MESNLALAKDAEKWEWKMMEHSVESIKGIRFRYFLSFPYGTHADFFAKRIAVEGEDGKSWTGRMVPDNLITS